VLYALDTPLNFVALLLGFLIAVLARGMAQAWTARALGSRDFEIRARSRPDIRRHGDVFGAVAAVLGGTGWGRAAPIEGVLGRSAYGRARGRPARDATLVLLVGPLTAGLLGVAALVAARVAGAPLLFLHELAPSDALHGDLFPATAGVRFLVCLGVAALAVGILALVPVPPLDGGRLLFALAPTSIGWQRARHYADQNWGVAILLLLLIIPFGSRGPALLAVVDAVGEPILRLISH
jgi:Zn-dependent protease